MGASAETGEALAWAIASDVPCTSPNHGYTSGAHGESWSTHTCGLNNVITRTAATSLLMDATGKSRVSNAEGDAGALLYTHATVLCDSSMPAHMSLMAAGSPRRRGQVKAA